MFCCRTTQRKRGSSTKGLGTECTTGSSTSQHHDVIFSKGSTSGAVKSLESEGETLFIVVCLVSYFPFVRETLVGYLDPDTRPRL